MPREGEISRERLIGHGRQSVLIVRRRQDVIDRFWGCVRRGAEKTPEFGGFVSGRTISAKRSGDPEIREYGMALSVKENVARFDIAVEDARAMRRVERIRDRRKPLEDLEGAHPSLAPVQPIPQASPFEVGEDRVRKLFRIECVDPCVEDRQDGRVIQGRQAFDLVEKKISLGSLIRPRWTGEFDDDLAPGAMIPGEMDHSHSAPSQQRAKFIPRPEALASERLLAPCRSSLRISEQRARPLRSHGILLRMADPGADRTHSRPSREPETPPPELRGFARFLRGLLVLLPKNALSRWMGWLASRSLPAPIQRFEIRLFARLTGVNLDEARDDVSDFGSLQEFFTRALTPGVRPLEGGEEMLVSPCDGAWGESGRIEAGTLLQVKGRRYRVAELLADARLAEAYEGGCYATFYLSPRDYHRFHTPSAGRITRIDYHPGSLWPVNAVGVVGIDRLFARNERIVALLEPDVVGAESRAPGIALVAVGATMVGSVRLNFSEFRTNVPGRPAERREFGERAPHFGRGEEWGRFEFGSTIVMLTPPRGVVMDARAVGQPLRLGEAIGRFDPGIDGRAGR